MDVGRRLPAKSSNADELYALLLEASAWLREKGLDQWNPEYPRGRFVRDIEEGRVWYWAADGQAIGTVTLHERRPVYYPPGIWEDSVVAWYVCRLTVSRKLMGRRAGEQLLEGLSRDADAAEIGALRLDVTCKNPFLEAYYIARGFERRHTGEIFGDRCAFLEKVIARGASLIRTQQ